MVELLDKLIGILCNDLTFEEYLKQIHKNTKDIEWADSLRKFISKTKSNLHSAKHSLHYQDNEQVKTLLIITERLIYFLINTECEQAKVIGNQ